MSSSLGLSREAPSPVSGGPTVATPPGVANGAIDVSGLVTERYDNITKPAEDKRSYRGLELTNKLKVLLVSDPVTDKSAAAVDVNVGYLSDPDYLPGLAHFCEHMLFLGTKKYPEENEYNKFLSEHGGSSNAVTGSDHTCYFFDVLPEYLAPTLDIFAQFFISPLFTEGMTERELNAVHSEHEKNISNDTWRLDQLNKSTADPGHPYSKFGTGNKETLEVIPREKGLDVREELLKFHSTWYSANVITLCVLGKESLDELESMVVPLFSEVANTDVQAPSWPEHPFPPERRRKRAFAVPIKDLRSMSVNFPIPDIRREYRSSHGQYLSHLFGHEGPGSLLSELKVRGWCNSLAGGVKPGGRGFSFFGVRVDLTEEGQNHIDDIVKLVFQYINLLRSAPPQKWIFEEQSRLMALSFNFHDTQEPRNFVSSHVHAIQEYPMDDVLSAHYLLTEWKPAQILELLEYLVVDNVRVGVASKAFEDRCKETERWYGTKYLLEDVQEDVLESWRTCGLCPALHLPPPNEFIPSNLDLATRESTDLPVGVPSIVKDTPFLRLWFRQDDEFLLPKASVTFEFVSPLAYSDPTNCNLTTLWVLLLKDALVEFAYAAELTELNWNISNAKYGITISIEGYDDKQHVLLEKIVSRIASFRADPKRFAIMKENHIRALKNFEAEQPYQHAVYHLAVLLTEHAWTRQQLLDGAKGLTVEMVEEFAARFMRRAHVEALILGNMTRDRALQLAAIVEQQIPKNAIPLLPQQLLLNREVQLEKGSHYLLEVHNGVHKNSCTELYYQCGLQETRANVVLELLLQIISEPCFNILRTKEQLGYIVFSGMRRSNGVQGLRLIVQSEKHPAVVEARVEAFLQHMKEYITEMPAEEFLRHKQALAAQRLQKPKQLGARAGQMWSEILLQQYSFERAQLEVNELESVSKEELLKYYEQHISIDSPDRQKLAVHVISMAEGGAGNDEGQGVDAGAGGDDGLLPAPEESIKAVKVTDIVEFKTKHALFPYPTPAVALPRKGTYCKL